MTESVKNKAEYFVRSNVLYYSGGTMKRLSLIGCLLALIAYSRGAEDAITDYLDNVKVGEAIEYRNLRIFPLIATKTLSTQNYLTLDEAMDNGWLKIREVSSGQVNVVEIKNKAKKMVFIMTGEIISGAKQDRMLKEDILLPPNSDWTRAPVYCVEHGRWTHVSPEFKSEKLLIPNAIRHKAKITENQSDVWDEIALSQERMNISSKTGTIRANYEDKKIQKEIDEYVKKLVPALSKSTIGVVVTTGNRIICLDMFAHNKLLRSLWRKLIKSYAMDAVVGEKGIVNKNTIEDFLETFEGVHCISIGTPGLGTLTKIESDVGKGSALIYKSAVVHLDFFPHEDILDNDSELRIDFRRNQRLDD